MFLLHLNALNISRYGVRLVSEAALWNLMSIHVDPQILVWAVYWQYCGEY